MSVILKDPVHEATPEVYHDPECLEKFSFLLHEIGIPKLLSLPAPIRELLKRSPSLEEKVDILERLAEQLGTFN